MLNVTSIRHSGDTASRRPRVAIVAGRDRRAVVKRVLEGRVEIVAELESDARIHLLHGVNPDIVFIDTESPRVNPFTASSRVIETGLDARIVLLCREQATAAAILRRVVGSDALAAVHPYDAASMLPASRTEHASRREMTTHAAA